MGSDIWEQWVEWEVLPLEIESIIKNVSKIPETTGKIKERLLREIKIKTNNPLK